jgi:plastocyanin
VIAFPSDFLPKNTYMKLNRSLALVASLTAVAQLAMAGNVTGKVTLKGTPAPEKEISQIKDDANCGKLHTETVKTRFYVVGANGELADTVVVLKGVAGKSTGASAAPLMVDQKGCEYVPYVAAVQTGQKISVKNSDPTMHNIHPSPVVSGNKEENKAQFAGAADLTFTFDAAEDFLKFKCDVHPWMFAYVSVIDHPYFAVTGKDGTFTIKDVPPGKYTIVAMHRKAAPAPKGVEQEIEVKADGGTANFTLEAK